MGFNPIAGIFNLLKIGGEMAFHRHRFPERDLNYRAQKLFEIDSRIEKDERNVESAIHQHIVERLKNFGNDEEKEIEEFIQEFKHALADIIALSKNLKDVLMKLQTEVHIDGVPVAQELRQIAIREIQELHKLNEAAGNALLQV